MYDFHNQKPLYVQLKEKLEEAILDGALKPNEVVPSIRALARNYQLNPLTVANAIDDLHKAGVIYKKRGVGMFVVEDAKYRIIRKQKDTYIDNDITQVLTKAKLLGIKKNEIQDILEFIFETND